MAFRVINQTFWDDPIVIDEYSCEDKYFWLYLMTNPHANQLGVYKLPLKKAAFQLGYSKEQVLVLIDRFQNSYKKILYNHHTQEIAIGEYLYLSVIKGGKPVMDAIQKDLSSITDIGLVKYLSRCTKQYIYNKQSLEDIYNLIISYIEGKNEYENEYDKDNDNDESYDESCYESLPESKVEKTNKHTSQPKTTASLQLQERFDKFWKAYPNKQSKKKAKEIFIRLKPTDELLETMLNAIERQKKSRKWTENGGQFIPLPTTWLNGELWEDELQEATAAKSDPDHDKWMGPDYTGPDLPF